MLYDDKHNFYLESNKFGNIKIDLRDITFIYHNKKWMLISKSTGKTIYIFDKIHKLFIGSLYKEIRKWRIMKRDEGSYWFNGLSAIEQGRVINNIVKEYITISQYYFKDFNFLFYNGLVELLYPVSSFSYQHYFEYIYYNRILQYADYNGWTFNYNLCDYKHTWQVDNYKIVVHTVFGFKPNFFKLYYKNKLLTKHEYTCYQFWKLYKGHNDEILS